MNLIRCPYGHIYDMEQYSSCPVCAQNHASLNQSPYMTGGQNSLPWQGNETSQRSVPGTRIVNGPSPFAQPSFPQQQGNQYPNPGFQQPFIPPSGPYYSPYPPLQNNSQTGSQNSYQPSVRQTPQAGKTQIFYSKSFSSEPIGGWLVCVMGNDKGKAFRVSAGKDTIGRSDTKKYKINISDEKISRSNPIGTISYVPDQHQFYFVSDPTGNLTPYVNGVPILTQIVLNDYDEIRIGSTVMLFRAFCSEKVNWDIIERQAAWQ